MITPKTSPEQKQISKHTTSIRSVLQQTHVEAIPKETRGALFAQLIQPVQPRFELFIQQVRAFLNFRCPIRNKRSAEKPKSTHWNVQEIPRNIQLRLHDTGYFLLTKHKINGTCGKLYMYHLHWWSSKSHDPWNWKHSSTWIWLINLDELRLLIKIVKNLSYWLGGTWPSWLKCPFRLAWM